MIEEAGALVAEPTENATAVTATRPLAGAWSTHGAAARRPLQEVPVSRAGLLVRRNEVRPPLVTVGIPAYRSPDLLQEALASLAAQEGFDDFEVVICDDLGLPATREVVELSGLPRVRLYRNERRLGAVANWNRCLGLAQGRWTTILHEDDLLYPWFFRLAVPRLETGVAALATRCAQGLLPVKLPRPLWSSPLMEAKASVSARARGGEKARVKANGSETRDYAPHHFLKSAMTPFPGVLFPTELGRALGGFDEKMGPVADYDFWYRLACAGPVRVVQEVAAFYRIHDEQWTSRAWPEMLRKMHLLRLRIAREQFPDRPRRGRWLARFFTVRTAAAFRNRFASEHGVLARAEKLGRIPLRRLPSGWVWRWLQGAGRRTRATDAGF